MRLKVLASIVRVGEIPQGFDQKQELFESIRAEKGFHSLFESGPSGPFLLQKKLEMHNRIGLENYCDSKSFRTNCCFR